MDDKEQLSYEEKKIKIEVELYKEITTLIECEYNMDKFDNLIYKAGGKKRAASSINLRIKECAEEYGISTDEIINILRIALQNISETCYEEHKELTNILSDIEKREKNIEEIKKEYTKEER